MLDVKSWLERAGEPVAETCFTPNEVPSLPYIVFIDKVKSGGGDMRILKKRHSLTVERYSYSNEDNSLLEGLLKEQSIEYIKEKQWLSNEECYLTTYDFELLEREVI